jgi:hypothetical protein
MIKWGRRLGNSFVGVLADTTAISAFLIAIVIAVTHGCELQAAEPPPHAYRAELPEDIRVVFRNPDGSCVQCSLGMDGAQVNVPELTMLLFDSQYGPGIHGGSSPSRVENYCNQRNIKVYNVTGSSTWDWMRYAAKTGRFAAIGAGTRHFQFLWAWDPRTNKWYVCNNNSPRKIDEYTWEQFQRLHLASGQWVVVPDYPPMPRLPRYAAWWTW